MIKVVVLGAGQVGTHLAKAIVQSEGVSLVLWYNRTAIVSQPWAQGILCSQDLNNLPLADVYIIAVSDDVVGALSKELTLENRLVVHTSGSVLMRSLSSKNRRGVFYPLQTFSKSAEINFNNVPICIEASDKNDRALLERLAKSLGSPTYFISSEQRQTLHLAAVFVNNFSNQLFRIAHELTDDKSLDFEILKPLIMETVKKVQEVSPYMAQTGPAKRKDKKTIKSHSKLLEHHPQFLEIYKILTQSIQQTHG